MQPADPSSATIALRLPEAAAAVERDFLDLGRHADPRRPLAVTSRSLELDGRPWLPVMGEFHYSRYPRGEWLTELRKMRAGGIDIVASYVFWNHHEAAEGRFDWSGQRDLRHFAGLVQQAGLHFQLRPGPWVHAEARHGGFPDWLVQGGALRCNDPVYLHHVTRFFGAIGEQLHGLMWADGGPVIGVQLENEYDRVGPGAGAEHIAALKRIAIEAGLAVPLYTVTGWPTLDIPPREVVPVSGAYPDGFWSGERGPLAPSGVFLFDTSRSIGEMGNVGGTPAAGLIDRHHYPFFLAEAGGGMHVSYHRRPVVDADDLSATCLVQVGSGATLYGYYMYHGGTNPGRGLQETQDSGYPNDVPVLGYDFRAPLGQYGQLRASYGRLRTLHLFLAAFGEQLATMEAVLPADAPADPADRQRLRVAARGAGDRGFVFINNHVRHHPMPDFADVRLRVEANGGTVTLPPFAVPRGVHAILPIGQRIGAARLRHATVQPLTRLVDGAHETWVAFHHPALPVELSFDVSSVRAFDVPAAWVTRSAHGLVLRPPAGEAPLWLRFTDARGQRHAVLLLSRTLAEQCARLPLRGRDRLVLCRHGVHAADDDTLVVPAPHDEAAVVSIFPADDLPQAAAPVDGFAVFQAAFPARTLPAIGIEVLHDNPQPPAVRMGPAVNWRAGPVPLAPQDEQFDAATRIHLQIDERLPLDQGRVMLAIDYIGDAARLHADGELVDDNFSDGQPWYVGIDRFARDGRWPRFELRIVAARDDLPIFLEDKARARLARTTVRAGVLGIEARLWRDHVLDLGSATWRT